MASSCELHFCKNQGLKFYASRFKFQHVPTNRHFPGLIANVSKSVSISLTFLSFLGDLSRYPFVEFIISQHIKAGQILSMKMLSHCCQPNKESLTKCISSSVTIFNHKQLHAHTQAYKCPRFILGYILAELQFNLEKS